jgi:hypothetical protein
MKSASIALFCLAAGAASAQPAINQAIVIDGVKILPDAKDPKIAHYAPTTIEVAKRDSGQPDLSLVQMRYTGRRATQDEGKFVTRSVLSFRLTSRRLTAEKVLALAKKYEEATKKKATLLPLKTAQFESELSLLRLGEAAPAAASPESASLGKGSIEGTGTWSPTEFWSDRTFVLFLDNATSMLLAEALKRGQTTLNFSYRFVSSGVLPSGEDWKPADFDASSNTLALSVDPAQNPDAIRQVDLNERNPAGYPLLSVFCFGFRDDLLSEVAVREIEIEATGVGGRKVTALYQFWEKERDVTLARVRFPFAVDLSKGFKYRLRDITPDGAERRSEWLSSSNWHLPLDISGVRVS